MEPPFKVPASPGTPLYPVSPERINQLRIPASPSLPNDLFNAENKGHHHRNSSDVQSKVAFLNGLTRTGSSAAYGGGNTTAQLQRAILGREEAESALSTATSQLNEAQIRERRISERLESLMEELQSAKERQVHERQVYEKEVRKARKDAFRAGSALVKLQEDLKDARSIARSLRDEVQKEKHDKEKSKQESFERAYTLAGLMEEMETMREKVRAVEADREAELLNHRAITLQEEAEAETPSRRKQDQDTFWVSSSRNETEQRGSQSSSPRKNRFVRPAPPEPSLQSPIKFWGLNQQQRRESFKENEDPEHEPADLHNELEELKEDLQWETKLRLRAEDLIHYMKIECQFKRCSCRLAESQGRKYICDWEWENKVRAESAARKENFPERQDQQQDGQAVTTTNEGAKPCELPRYITQEEDEPSDPGQEQTLAFSPTTGTFHRVSSPIQQGAQESEPTAELQEQMSSLTPPTLAALLVSEAITMQSPIRQVPPTPPASSTPSSSTPTGEPPHHQSQDVPSSTPKPSDLASPTVSPSPITPTFKTPTRPAPRTIHSHTTTTTVMVPLRGIGDEDIFSPMPGTPGTPVSREQALAQIRARRDRARSVTRPGSAPGSARRGVGMRDISAPSRF